MVARLGNTTQAQAMFTEETFSKHQDDVLRLKKMGWTGIVTEKLVQTCGINQAIEDDYKFAKIIMKCLGKYCDFDWGDTCKEDWTLNDMAVNSYDRVVAKYKTTKGDIFIITEHDRSVTTILFAHEY